MTGGSGVVLILGALLTSGACAPHRFNIPTGAGEPAPDAQSAWTQATHACRDGRTLSAELRLSGHAGSSRVRGTVHGAVTAADQIYLEMPSSFGASYFILAGTAERATLLLPRDSRVLTARAEDIIEALIGLKLGPRRLLALLAGCADQTATFSSAAKFGELIAVTTPRARVFIRAGSAGWRVAAAEADALIVDYGATQGTWPTQLRMTSAPGRTPAIEMSVGVSQIEVNGQLDPTIFVLTPPAGATPLTLDELRSAGPLGDKKQ